MQAMKKIVLALTGMTLAATLAFSQQPATPTGNVERGKALYEQVGCYQCHGRAGQGSQATGPRLSHTQYPFEAFLVMLRHPVKQMPPYEAVVLPDQDAADIFAYVQQMPAPRDPKSIPLLNAER
jgi:mono/diheme cytochrome c family protein